jgi:hypothetical protein
MYLGGEELIADKKESKFFCIDSKEVSKNLRVNQIKGLCSE